MNEGIPRKVSMDDPMFKKWVEATGLSPVSFDEHESVKMAIIRPAEINQEWDENALFSFLEEAIRDPRKYVQHNGLMMGKVHFADQISEITDRFSMLTINYTKALSKTLPMELYPIFLSWAYEFINTILCTCRDRKTVIEWIFKYRDYFDAEFLSGIETLKKDLPVVIASPPAGLFMALNEFAMDAAIEFDHSAVVDANTLILHGNFYFHKKKDYKKAYPLYLRAAQMNDVSSQHNLGVMFSEGLGVCKNIHEAIKWYRLAAESGFAYSQHNMGDAYLNGKGVPFDLNEAQKWFSLAAEQGLSESMDILEEIKTFKDKKKGVFFGEKRAP